jgi:sulfatase maturation enzyme AslB (radical SAM superfamily)
MNSMTKASTAQPVRAKFENPEATATGEPRAFVPLRKVETLWFNTGTLCNIRCANCYIESSPRNDRLVYLSAADVRAYLDEIKRNELNTRQIGFTGGEPFMNPEILAMLEECLSRGFEVLVLTNAMRPMQRWGDRLIEIRRRYQSKLLIRVSIDHYSRELHEKERGPDTWEPTVSGLRWLSEHGFNISVAGRTRWGEEEEDERRGYERLFRELGMSIDGWDLHQTVLFPEMDEAADVPEITTRCWAILGKSPDDVMCSESRMVVKRKGAARPVVMACTLIAYDGRFEMGESLADARGNVKLNHPHCAKFCVLGGGSCTQ